MFTRFVFPVLVFSVIIAVGYWCVLLVKKFRVNQRLEIHLQFLEQRYLEFIHNRELLGNLRNEPDAILVQAILEESHPILKPEIDALLDQFDQANQSLLPKSLDSDIFPNVLAAYRNLWTEKAGTSRLTNQQRHSFQESVKEAIKADVHRRILLLQTNA